MYFVICIFKYTLMALEVAADRSPATQSTPVRYRLLKVANPVTSYPVKNIGKITSPKNDSVTLKVAVRLCRRPLLYSCSACISNLYLNIANIFPDRTRLGRNVQRRGFVLRHPRPQVPGPARHGLPLRPARRRHVAGRLPPAQHGHCSVCDTAHWRHYT